MSPLTVLVVGATGATGHHVVQQLLDHADKPVVKVVARSQARMLELLNGSDYGDRLVVTEASLLDLSTEDIENQVSDADAVVSCLGHNMNFKGMYGHPRQLVTDAVTRLTTAMMETTSKGGQPKKKFLLMNADGVSHPAGTDTPRSFVERTLLAVLRIMLPPIRDQEGAAAYLHTNVGTSNSIEWVVVRPTDLVNADVSKYVLGPKPTGSLFGGGVATRSNVAKSMVDLIFAEDLWQKWKFEFPVLYDKEIEAGEDGKGEL